MAGRARHTPPRARRSTAANDWKRPAKAPDFPAGRNRSRPAPGARRSSAPSPAAPGVSRAQPSLLRACSAIWPYLSTQRGSERRICMQASPPGPAHRRGRGRGEPSGAGPGAAGRRRYGAVRSALTGRRWA